MLVTWGKSTTLKINKHAGDERLDILLLLIDTYTTESLIYRQALKSAHLSVASGVESVFPHDTHWLVTPDCQRKVQFSWLFVRYPAPGFSYTPFFALYRM